MRKTPALLSAVAAAALIVVSLVGCSSSASASCTSPYAAGSSSKLVKATSTTAKFPTPMVVTSNQVSVNSAGKGAVAQPGDQVDYTFAIYSGETGESIGGATSAQRSGAEETAKSMSIQRSLICAQAGERYTLVTTVKDAFGKGAGSNAGLSDKQTLVIVVDVKDTFLGKANGINQLPLDGMPAVITAVSGQPGIVIQELNKPTTLRISTIKAGAGPVVKKNATVHVKYSGWTWPDTSTSKPVLWPGGSSQDGTAVPGGDATWTKDQAADFKVSRSALPVGFYKALVGAKVGSQILVVIPPKDGFGSSSTALGFTANDTVIMVIDVLGIA